MRSGVLISAVSHVVLVALVLLGTPKLFDSVPLEAIEVDLVRPDQAPPEPPKEPEKKPDDKLAPWNLLPAASVVEQQTPTPESAAPQPKPKQPEAATPQPKPKQPEAAASQPKPKQPEAPPPTQQALGPPVPSPSPPQQPPAQQPSIFDPANIPALMNLPNVTQLDFDSESTATADLSSDDKSVLKAHLKKCWKLPAGVSATQSTRVVLRVFLKRDGALTREPVLVEASASVDGPLVMQAAIRALKDCQPFGFLPADKYREWRVLDLSFSPREMAGG